jgi:hypothetical protein
MANPSSDDVTRKQRQREYQRQWRAANPEKVRAIARKYREAHPDKLSAQNREYRSANSDQLRDKERRRRTPDLERERGLKRLHGIDGARVAAMWKAQEHNCYLCGRHLDLDKAFVEHWHGCQAGHDPKTSCGSCRRGLAHHNCNILIAFAGDDPDLLRLIADNLEAANRSVQKRQEKAPQQLTLEPG